MLYIYIYTHAKSVNSIQQHITDLSLLTFIISGFLLCFPLLKEQCFFFNEEANRKGSCQIDFNLENVLTYGSNS